MAIPTYRGSAIPVLSLPPDWSGGVKWRQLYSTIVTESLNGAEERQARFPRALYGLKFRTVGLTAAETAYLRALIEKPDALPVACPLWPLAARLMADAGAGSTSLTTDATEDCLFEVLSDFALLWADFETWEVVELSSVSSTEITLSAVTARAYSAGALFLPLAYGHAARGNIDQLTDEHGQWDCEFNETFHRLHDQSLSESDAVA